MTSRLKEESPKKEIKEVKDYLEKFVKQQPDGLYRGEALIDNFISSKTNADDA